ncbi:MAG: hypothetical protein K6G88_10440 [Lachnospiraceae bacterium]|nr:hypothetical protein [Lachnospiraceae bacterium]
MKSVANSVFDRIRYFQIATNLCMVISKKEDDYTEISSIPINCENICFIIGHRFEIDNYLEKEQILEKNIVFVTCLMGNRRRISQIKGKNIYISSQLGEYTYLLEGKQFGFGFDLTKSELQFYNTRRKYDIKQRIELFFTKVKKMEGNY